MNHKSRKIFKDFYKIRIGIFRIAMHHSQRLNYIIALPSTFH